MAIRFGRFKLVFSEQRAKGLEVWRAPQVPLCIPRLFDLRADPFERREESFKYNDWFVENVPFQYAAQVVVHEWLESFKTFPQRAKSASFSIDSRRGPDAQVVARNTPTPSRPLSASALQCLPTASLRRTRRSPRHARYS